MRRIEFWSASNQLILSSDVDAKVAARVLEQPGGIVTIHADGLSHRVNLALIARVTVKPS